MDINGMLNPSLASRILAGPQDAPSYGVPRLSVSDARTSEYVYIVGLACSLDMTRRAE